MSLDRRITLGSCSYVCDTIKNSRASLLVFRWYGGSKKTITCHFCIVSTKDLTKVKLIQSSVP